VSGGRGVNGRNSSPIPRRDASVDLLSGWIMRQAAPEGAQWLGEALRNVSSGEERPLVRALGLAPRRIGRADLALDDADLAAAEQLRPGFDPRGLSLDQAARIALLLAAAGDDEAAFVRRIEALSRTADVIELIAFYRGLPLYPAQDALLAWAGEGIRSGMAPVFEAVAHASPYPRERFDEARWNQMVLKALFIGAKLAPIQGLDARANPTLARMLVDYAAERRSAGRAVSPELWRCVGPFTDARAVAALEEALRSGSREEAFAAVLALRAAPDPRARALLDRHPESERALDAAGTDWNALA
jgi:hypothetical protein